MKSAIDSELQFLRQLSALVYLCLYSRKHYYNSNMQYKVENKEIKFFTWTKQIDFRVYNDTFNCEVDTACYVVKIFFL